MAEGELTADSAGAAAEDQKVLVVEDSATASTLISRALDDMDLTVVTATTGPEALTLNDEHHFDCILLDVELAGGMSGYEVCAAIRETSPDQMVPVLFITARDGAQDRSRALALGALDFIGKPFERPELAVRVRNALRIRALQMELARCRTQLDSAARLDIATGVANRGELNEQLIHACSIADRYGRPLSVLLADLDHLRLANDQFGMEAGDRVLHDFAQLLVATGRDADTVGRFGDDEFMIICPETEVSGVAVLAGRIRAATEATLGEAIGGPAVTASLGCAEKLPDEPPEILVRRCAQALDTAKLGGRNRVCLARTESASLNAPEGDL